MEDATECEGIARAILDESAEPFPVNPWRLLARLGIRTEYGRPGEHPHPRWDGERWTVYLDPSDRPVRQAAVALHELGHVLLQAHGTPNTEANAWLIAGALLLPRDEVLRAQRRGVPAERIACLSPWASQEMAARRLVAMGESLVLWVHDVAPEHRQPYRVVSPGWRWPLRQPTSLEREAMDAALEGDCAVEVASGVRAWTATDPPWVRVLCLSDGEALIARHGERGRLSSRDDTF